MMNKSELTPEAVYLWTRGASCLLFDHRGQGRSGGKRCGFGVDERVDIAAAVYEAKRRKPEARIVLIGSSMGSAAIALALADDPSLADAAILDSCYDHFVSASLGWWRFLGGKALMVALAPTVVIAAPFAGFNPFSVSISKALSTFDSVPILFLHGDSDNLALPSEAEHNFNVYRGPKSIVWFEGCRHSEGRWNFPDKYRAAVDQFLEKNELICRQPTPPSEHPQSPLPHSVEHA
jgi:alpha-beta hydrolase superfamily lysophospholipase